MSASPPSHISECETVADVYCVQFFACRHCLSSFFSMSGPNSSSEWSIEGRRLVPLMPRLVPQTAFTAAANAVASVTANQNASLLLPAETGNKEGSVNLKLQTLQSVLYDIVDFRRSEMNMKKISVCIFKRNFLFYKMIS